MKRALLILLLLAPLARGAEVARAGSHVFHSSFWLNLHDRLHHETFVRWTHYFNEEEAGSWESALVTYRRQVGGKNLTTDPEMAALAAKLATTDDSAELAGDGAIETALRKAAPVYRAHQWKHDDAANRFWIAMAMAMLREMGDELTREVSRAYGVTWPQRLQIDVVGFAHPNGGRTTGGPLMHTMVSSRHPDYQGFAALELLFHEPLHHFDEEVETTIDNLAARAKIAAPKDLDHALHFYTAGELTRRAFARRGVRYTPTAYALGLHKKFWPSVLPVLETHWQSYLDGKLPREEALAKVIGSHEDDDLTAVVHRAIVEVSRQVDLIVADGTLHDIARRAFAEDAEARVITSADVVETKEFSLPRGHVVLKSAKIDGDTAEVTVLVGPVPKPQPGVLLLACGTTTTILFTRKDGKWEPGMRRVTVC
jgi:hypothetical protein